MQIHRLIIVQSQSLSLKDQTDRQRLSSWVKPTILPWVGDGLGLEQAGGSIEHAPTAAASL